MIRIAFLILGLLAWSCSCRTSSEGKLSSFEEKADSKRRALALALATGFTLDRTRTYAGLAKFTESVHPMGSPKQLALARFIEDSLAKDQILTKLQKFRANLPIRDVEPAAEQMTFEVQGQNVFAKILANGDAAKQACTVMLGSHYDTKDIPGVRIVGANDSGSSSVALIHIMSYLAKNLPDSNPCDVSGVWFDGEESYLIDWHGGLRHPSRQQDNTYGSRHFASELQKCGDQAFCLPDDLDPNSSKVIGLALLDMIGSSPLALTDDLNSDPNLRNLLLMALKDLGLSHILSPHRKSIEDDHMPFLAMGIPAIDLINFENLEHWHTENDTIEHINLDHMESISRVAIYLAVYMSSG